jgi:hypothetical protein
MEVVLMPQPKIIATFIVGAVTYALLRVGVEVDKELEGLITLGAGLLAGYLVPNGPVRESYEGEPVDDEEPEVGVVRAPISKPKRKGK